MIELQDSVYVAAPPERVWAWLSDLPVHYREWHPAHVSCRYERGESLQVGTILYVEEYLHGRLHKLHLRATAVEPGHLLRYVTRAFRGAFVVEPVGEGTSFTAQLSFGTRTPLVGGALDALLRSVLSARLTAFRTHMHEEGENLKRLLEQESSA